VGQGLLPVVGLDVDLYPPCLMAAVCLATPGQPIMTVQTDAQGRYVFRLSVAIVRQRLFVLIQATVDGVRCRILLTPSRLAALARAQGVQLAGVETDEIRIDPISEAAVRLLEAAGADNFSDDGIAAVMAAVDAANADTIFDGLSVAAANNLAETTAANDPTVQMVIAESQFTPTPTVSPTPIACVGDCNHNGIVTVDELIRGVNIALGNAAVSICPEFDRDGSQTVTINELIAAVNAALNGCL